MNRKQKMRIFSISMMMIALGIAIGLVLFALKKNINLFYTPTQLIESHTTQKNIRIGGYVKKKSVHFDSSGESVNFIVTDYRNEIAVNYHGLLPNLFREGQGVVVTGKLIETLDATSREKRSAGMTALSATEVLAKHDERYIPATLEKELKKGSPHAR